MNQVASLDLPPQVQLAVTNIFAEGYCNSGWDDQFNPIQKPCCFSLLPIKADLYQIVVVTENGFFNTGLPIVKRAEDALWYIQNHFSPSPYSLSS